MGHQIEHRYYKENVDKKRVQADLDNYVRCHCWQEGSSGLNAPIRWLDHICDNSEDAMEYIKSHDKGWYDQLAVKYREYQPIEPSATLLALQKRWKAENEKKSAYEQAHSVRSFKAEFVGCPSCGSKLKKDLLRGESCPLCRTELRSKTTMETLARYESNLRDLSKKISAEQKKMEQKNLKKSTVKWLVKIEFHV